MTTVSIEYSQKMTSIQKSLYAFILSLIPNRVEAEDILQETNLILCQKAEEYDPNGHFQGWAFKIARFQVMKHQTNRKRSKIHFSKVSLFRLSIVCDQKLQGSFIVLGILIFIIHR